MTTTYCHIPILSALSLLVLAPNLQSQQFSLKDYQHHVYEYLQSLEGLAVEVTTTDHALDRSLIIQTDYSIVSIPGHFRVKVTTRKTKNDDTVSLTTHWVLFRPDGFFIIAENAKVGGFVLQEMRQAVSSPLLVNGAALTALGVLTRPVCDGRFSLLHLLQGHYAKDGHTATVTAFLPRGMMTGKMGTLQVTRAASGQRIKVDYEFTDRWLIHQSVATVGVPKDRELKMTTAITYTQLGDRTLPSRVTISRSDVPADFVAEYRNYQLYHGDQTQFSLSQFGLPEPRSASPGYQSSIHWHLWLLAIAGALLTLGGVFRYRLRLK